MEKSENKNGRERNIGHMTGRQTYSRLTGSRIKTLALTLWVMFYERRATNSFSPQCQQNGNNVKDFFFFLVFLFPSYNVFFHFENLHKDRHYV